jgi:threonine dehydrogenase-like Zn-dependent dehydrogenase
MIAGWDRTPFGAIPGHEWSGTVDAAGGGGESLVGRKCVAENVWASDGGEVGFEHPGGYAEYFVAEAANVRVLPDEFDPGAAALIEPLAVCVRALKRLTHSDIFEPRRRDIGRALVLGDGPIGLLTVALLGNAAEDLVLVGGRPGRLDLARRLGARAAVNYHDLPEGDFAGAVLRALPGRGRAGRFDTLIEASGSPAAMDACLDLAAPCGRIVIVGDYAQARAGFAWNAVLHRQLEMIGSNASAGAWDQAVALACAGAVPLTSLVTHRLPAESFAEGIDLMRSRRADVVKVVLEWTG